MKLQASNISKSFGAEQVLEKASLQIKNNEKVALVGRNGCGKTTLLKIISGQLHPDGGDVAVQNQIRVGYLAQVTFANEDRTVQEELESVFDELKSLEQQMNEQAMKLAEDSSDQALERFDRLQTRFEIMGGYEYEHELRSVFFHFGFSEEELNKKLSEFSSGQRTRIGLVKLLLEKPDILLLDEPTNHLDIDSIEWLENYISHYPSAVILVSHDRVFLDRVADEIVEIEFGRTTRYPGNYSHYVQAKKEYLEKNHDAFVRQQQEIARIQELIEKFRYKKNKAAFAQSKIKYLDRMEKIEDSASDTSMIHVHFSSARRGGKRVLEVQDLKIGYDQILSTLNFTLIRGDHLAIVGKNGIGKSTFIKTLMHQVEPKGGSFAFGHQIDIGYFDQDSAQLHSNKQVLDELWDEFPEADQTQIRNALACFLFQQDDVFKDVNALSGGQRILLALAKLMLAHDNLLILDEPTNHLDIPAKEALEDALMEYDGTILFVSHDRMFLKKMATRVLEMDNQSTLYNETYDEYLEHKKSGMQSAPVKSAAIQPASAKKEFQDLKSLKNRVARLEDLLTQAEDDLSALRELRFEPEYYQDYRKMEELDAQIDEKHNEINRYMKEWEEKSALLEEAGS